MVTCVRWGGDNFVYTASRDATINVWEGNEGKLIKTLKVGMFKIYFRYIMWEAKLLLKN